MDSTAPLLVATIFLPAVGALLAMGSREHARQSALITTLFVLGMTVMLVVGFPGGAEPFAVFDFPWFGSADAPVDIRFSLALDGLSLWLFALTALLTVVSVLVSWEAIKERASTFYAVLLLLETGMLGVFAARDIVLFFICFEFTLIPLFFLIGVWGSEERRHAAIKFFLFTMAGSVLTFLGLISIVLWDYYHAPSGRMTFSIAQLTADLAARPMDRSLQLAVFLALFAGFAIKVPLVPLHTWLPLAHVQAPTAGSVLLAGVLLKVGTYGFVRFALPMTPDAVVLCMPWLLWLAVAGIVYGALVALAQQDIKRLIAYSSVSHLGFCMLGVFALNRLGIEGGVLQMVNHGLATGGLFAVVGMLYERFHTRHIDDLGGLARQLPRLATFMVILTLSSIGLPGLNGFVGEFLLLLGMFQRAWVDAPPLLAGQYRVIAVLAISGVVLGAWYMLQLVQRVFFGPLRTPAERTRHAPRDEFPHAEREEHIKPPADLSLRESFALGLLVVFIFWIGVQPRFFLDRMSPTLEKILTPVAQSYARQEGKGGKGEGRRGKGEESVGSCSRSRQTSGDVSSNLNSGEFSYESNSPHGPPVSSPLSLLPSSFSAERGPTHAH